MRSDRVDLTGKVFGRLTVIAEAPRLSSKNARWHCVCVCGNKTVAQGGSLISGRHISCGCLQKEVSTKHGMEKTLTYKAWSQMKSRCSNPKHKSYKDYGARGITVCERWKLFENFYADMGEKPHGLSLDRIDNNGGYSPENCRWADAVTQCNNKRKNHVIEFDGQKKTMTQWANHVGISPQTFKSRLRAGWSIGDILSKPIDKKYSTKRKTLIH